MSRRKSKRKRKNEISKFKIYTVIGVTSFVILNSNVLSPKINTPTIIKNNSSIFNSSNELSTEVINSLDMSDDVISSLVDKSDDNPTLINILNNINDYPSSLLKLASKNNEALDFVYNYPKKSIDGFNNTSQIESTYTTSDIPLFIQWDERWGYETYGDDFMALTGCGPTSLSMVVRHLTNDKYINPSMMAEFAYNNGHYADGIGSSWSLMTEGANYFGLNSQSLPINESNIISSLKNDRPIIMSVKPGIFTDTGHFIVLTGINENNQISINDPNSIINSSKVWSIDTFIQEGRAMWSYSNL